MMKRNTVTRSILLAIMVINAMTFSAFNKKDYKEFADDIRRQIWTQKLPEFANPKCTERYADKSEVIIAAYDEFVVTKKMGNIINELNGETELNSHVLTRRMVQINDKAALEHYAEFDYLAFASRRLPYYGKIEMHNVLGVRVIKPDGTIKEVSTDDYVVTSEGEKGKDERQMLAVPGLEIGDIIDICTFRFANAKNIAPEPMTFFFVTDAPMLSYRVHCEIDRDLPAHYRTLNGAPDFTISTNDTNDNVLDVRVTNVERTEPSLWYSTSRQTPLTLLYVQLNSPAGNSTMPSHEKGLMCNPNAEVLQADDWAYWNSQQGFVGLDKRDKNAVKEALEKFTGEEQRADYLYEHQAAYLLDKRLAGTSQTDFIMGLRACFNKAHITYQCGITTTTGREPIDELASYGNTTWFLRIPGGKCYFTPLFACRPGEVPHQLQGRKAVVCTNAKQKLTEGPYKEITLPQSDATDNVGDAVITASIQGTSLHIDRTVKLSGALRQDLSVMLPTCHELVSSILENHNLGMTRKDLYDKKYEEAIAEQDAEQKKMQQEIMKAEIEHFYDMAPAEMGEAEILSVGTTYAKPLLSYEGHFKLEGLVKRAGQDLVLSIGKLLGSQMKIEGQERERNADIIRTAPQCNKWDITINIPEGYTVESSELERLQTKVENATGSFWTILSMEDGKLHLKANKTILHEHEPLENWPLLLELYDHIYDYSSRNIIIQCKKMN